MTNAELAMVARFGGVLGFAGGAGLKLYTGTAVAQAVGFGLLCGAAGALALVIVSLLSLD